MTHELVLQRPRGIFSNSLRPQPPLPARCSNLHTFHADPVCRGVRTLGPDVTVFTVDLRPAADVYAQRQVATDAVALAERMFGSDGVHAKYAPKKL